MALNIAGHLSLDDYRSFIKPGPSFYSIIIPTHTDIKGNKEADVVAKKATG